MLNPILDKFFSSQSYLKSLFAKAGLIFQAITALAPQNPFRVKI